MYPPGIRFFMRGIDDAIATLLLLVILVVGSILWEKVKSRWQAWKLSRGKGR